MSELKKGDLVEIKIDFTEEFKIGDVFSVSSIHGNSAILSTSVLLHKSFLKKIGASTMKYEESNRYKLAKAVKEKIELINSKEIKATAEILSLATGNSKTYFSTQTAKSKFLSRGDIPSKTYQSMLADLAFAERKVLGIEAKAVDNQSIAIKYGTCDIEIGEKIQRGDSCVGFSRNFEKSQKNDDYVDSLSYGVYGFKEHQDAKEESTTSKRPLVLFLIMVILAFFYFLNLSFGWV